MRESLFVRQRDRLVEHLEDLWKRCNYSFGLPIPSTNDNNFSSRRRVLVRLPATSFVPGKGNKTTKIPQKRGKSKIPNFACTSNDALVLCVFFSSNCKVLLQYSATSDWKITKYLFLTVLLIGLMLIKLQIGCSKYLWSLYVCLFDVAFVLKKSH